MLLNYNTIVVLNRKSEFMSKVIVLDLDQTLRSLETSNNCNELKVVLRPQITTLLQKLSDVKNKGIDSVIFTSATRTSAIKYFLEKLPEECRGVFTEIISRENFPEPKLGTRENYLYRVGENKIVTALDYDEILFFEDSQTEYKFLEELFDKENYTDYPVPDKSVTFVNLPFYPRTSSDMYALKELAKQSDSLKEKVNDYFTLMVNEPGCKIMANVIDEFISKDNPKGLINLDIEEFDEYEANLRVKNIEIRKILSKDENLRNKYFDLKNDYYLKEEIEDDKELL